MYIHIKKKPLSPHHNNISNKINYLMRYIKWARKMLTHKLDACDVPFNIFNQYLRNRWEKR